METFIRDDTNSQSLSVRIVHVDYYLAKPVTELEDPCYSGFRSLPIYRVPIIRIFGPTSEGEKCCIHIHGVFPYLFIPNWDRKLREKDFYAFATSLDKAINTSFGYSSSKTCHVHRISAVSSRPYYGYYEDEKQFLKIEFYNPVIIKRAADLLLSGAVFSTRLQPHEAHVPYILQFFIDNNLYGMSYATFSSYRRRSTISSNESNGITKQTYVALEVDSSVKHIIRESTSGDDKPNNPGLAFIWQEERNRRKLQNRDSQITPDVSQLRPENKPTRTERFYKNKLAEKLKRFSNSNVVEQDSMGFEENDVINSCELDTQGRSILALLEELSAENHQHRRSDISSPPLSPLIVFSDEEENTKLSTAANVASISSQPLLKLNAENDSILGDNFSEDDIDEEDHLILSQSTYQRQTNEFSECVFDEIDNISQLDGADGDNCTQFKKQTKRESKSRYNLRSRDTDLQKSKDKSTPKKLYPQLEIATQMSPRSATRVSCGSQSALVSENSLETFSSSCAQDSLRSPNTGSQSKRAYPALDVNFRKSPRSQTKVEPEEDVRRRRSSGRIKKRKIDFDDLDMMENPEMSLMTTRWKKIQKSKKNQKFLYNEEKSETIDDMEDLFAQHMPVSDTTYVLDHGTDNAEQESGPSASYTVSNEVGSQKYSLKIHFDACGSVDRNEILNDLFSKVPMVVMQKMDLDECKVQKSLVNDTKYADMTVFHDDSSLEPSLSCKLGQDEYNGETNLSPRVLFSNEVPSTDLAKLSNEIKKSSEVDFWDDCGVSTLKDAAIHNESSSTSTGTLPETVVLSQKSRDSQETSSVDSYPTSPLSNECEKCDELENHFLVPKERMLLANTSKYSKIDEEFSPVKSRPTKTIIKERFPDFSIFEAPVVDDDENLAPVHNLNFKIHFQMKNSDAIETTYSSINDDGFSKPEAHSKTVAESTTKSCVVDKSEDAASQSGSSDIILFSQNSVDDEAFANFSFSQIDQLNSAGKLENRKIFKENTETTVERERSPRRLHIIPDNSIWDTTETITDDENEIFSFYGDKSVSQINVTTFCETSKNEDGCSPEVELLTPQNEKEILSWNNEEGFLSLKVSNKNPSDGEETKPQSPVPFRKSSAETSWSDGSPTTTIKENVLHSTPQHLAKKKSPSPTYTPILKKLMLKRMGDQTKGTKSRISSHRFRTEAFLVDIKEEEELKTDKVAEENTTISSVEITTNTSAGKNSSEQKSHTTVGSGQIDLTMSNTYGFRMGLENLQNVNACVQHQFITVMSVEVFATTRNNLNPDPEFDAVFGVFYSIFHDVTESSKLISGFIVVDESDYRLDFTRFPCEKQFVKNENELLDNFISLVRKWDPDILVGYEIEMSSWGYLIQRSQYLGRNYLVELSRVRDGKMDTMKEKSHIEDNEYSDDLKLVGRIVLNVWRLMRHEIALQSYTFENIFFHILHQRVPKHSFRCLTEWWKNLLRRWIVIDYYLLRVESNILLLQQLDFVGRTSELARLFGIQFYEVLSRGSQFRVESMMLRLAKKQNFVAVSPSTKQRAAMRAAECVPLIMEPESKFYTDPVIVLDFQSLYPSIIIAYNYCFSTCLGRVEYLAEKETFNFGCVQHTVPIDLLSMLQSSINISPCGVAFVKENIRRGILPEMLEEILNTRLMVKRSMKANKNDKTLQRVLHARQLGLKLIANVTYGYTSANFSGRMPCIEVGDSVVSKGRETLERVIEMVSKNERWAAKVVYGDTDSIFVLVPNRGKAEAFRIGAEIAEAVTNNNPKPVKLKLEKVYYPCILQTKKRYAGYMYESADQIEPVYDAKGIETVRRDGCPAVAKILEKSLKIIFETKDINCVKKYVQHQFSKLDAGRVSIQELTFAREYRGMKNYKPSACVPALRIARQAIVRDRRSEPRVKERVPYVLTVGPPGVPLIESVRTPQEFLDTPGAIINTEYYITRAIIPALERCFSLLGVDVRVWYAELPRKRKLYLPVESDLKNKIYRKNTISHYFATSKCIACQKIAVVKVCEDCQKNSPKLALTLGTMINKLQRKYNYLEKVCRSCTSRNDMIECSSLDCSVYYNYRQAIRDVEQIPYFEELQQTFLRCLM